MIYILVGACTTNQEAYKDTQCINPQNTLFHNLIFFNVNNYIVYKTLSSLTIHVFTKKSRPFMIGKIIIQKAPLICKIELSIYILRITMVQYEFCYLTTNFIHLTVQFV